MIFGASPPVNLPTVMTAGCFAATSRATSSSECKIDVRGDVDWVDTGLRHSAMAAGAVNRNAEQVQPAANVRFTAQHEAGRRAGMDMQSETGLRRGLAQHTGRKHCLRTGKALLVGLKYELDGTIQLALIPAQQLCRTKQHRCVQRVHTAVLRAKGQVWSAR